jgi:hypothetical protein
MLWSNLQNVTLKSIYSQTCSLLVNPFILLSLEMLMTKGFDNKSVDKTGQQERYPDLCTDE